jgi:hypothetical protein
LHLQFSVVVLHSKWCNSGQKPEDIPSNPERAYKNQWTSWGDFLGTGSVVYQVVHGQQLPLSWLNLDNRLNQDFHGL